MTTFKEALSICGLSQVEAADYLGARIDTVKSWSQGRNPPPMGVWRDLARLYARLEEAAEEMAGRLEPGLMDRRIANSIQAERGPDPLPGHAAATAGAMALLLAVMMDEEGA